MPKELFHHSSTAEGLTLILLVGVAVPMKHLLGHPEVVRLLGPLHGLAFLVYLYSLWSLYQGNGLSNAQLLSGIMASFVPGGSWLFRQRLEATRVSMD